MTNILNEIAEDTRKRVESSKKTLPLTDLKKRLGSIQKVSDRPFENALKADGISLICEIKRASPSKGMIAEEFPYLEIAKEYESAGASCISVLTEPRWFKGDIRYLDEISSEVSTPIIRKDFIVDEYMIYEAKLAGASAVLLICSILEDDQIKEYLRICDDLNLSALVETHDETEVRRAIDCGARIIGINNRDLRDFTVDINNGIRLRSLIPDGIITVAESGIKNHNDILELQRAGFDAALIGETIMRSKDKAEIIRQLKYGKTKVKICGLMRDIDIYNVNLYRPDYAGFIMCARFRRFVNPEDAKRMVRSLSEGIQSVSVFVDQPLEEVVCTVKDVDFDLIQLHGQEDNEYIYELRKKTGKQIIKAFKITCEKDVLEAMNSKADLILLDGGNGEGKSFDWSLLKSIKRDFILAGGLTPDNVKSAVETIQPYAVDTSSGVETEQFKDEQKISDFIRAVRTAGSD